MALSGILVNTPGQGWNAEFHLNGGVAWFVESSGKQNLNAKPSEAGSTQVWERKFMSSSRSTMFIISRTYDEQIFIEWHKPHMVGCVSRRRLQIWQGNHPEVNIQKDLIKKCFGAQTLIPNIYTITQRKCTIQTSECSMFKDLSKPHVDFMNWRNRNLTFLMCSCENRVSLASIVWNRWPWML